MSLNALEKLFVYRTKEREKKISFFNNFIHTYFFVIQSRSILQYRPFRYKLQSRSSR